MKPPNGEPSTRGDTAVRKSNSQGKIIPLRDHQTTRTKKIDTGRGKGLFTIALGYAFGLLAVVVFTVISSDLLQPGAWRWYVVLLLLAGASVLCFINARSLGSDKKRLAVCIRCHRQVDDQSGICRDCKDKTGFS
jgi:hypothetical protein